MATRRTKTIPDDGAPVSGAQRLALPELAPAESRRLDAGVKFVAFASKAQPLTSLLDGFPARAAAVLEAQVVSLYLLEGHGEGLVLRGNVGFDPTARGRVRLSVGEGLTGLAVEARRPVSVVRASGHESFRRFSELDEDRYPVFLAIPIVGSDERPLGALVAQRSERAFSPDEILTATVLTAPVAHAVRHAALLDELRDKPTRKTGGGTRKVTLPGRPVIAGRALGGLAALRRPAKDRKMPARPDELKLVSGAFETAEKALRGLQARAHALHLVGETSFLANYALMASDERLRERAIELVKSGRGAAEALSTVAREVARAATGLVGDPFMAERARDIEDLCDAVLMLASPDARAELPAKAVLLGEQITVFDLLVTARNQPSGVVLTQRANPRTEVLLRLLGVPAIDQVEKAFQWASPGDVALVDADHGFLIINPSRAEVATLRAQRRDNQRPVPPPLSSRGA
jgi:phosphotransferase system enzyme I (PtsP)